VGLESLVCDQHKLINPHELDLFEPIYFVFMLNESQRWQHVSSAFSSECDAFIESCIKKGMNARFEKVSLEDINKEFYKKFFPELTK
jgi:predicted transcriptional regulator